MKTFFIYTGPEYVGEIVAVNAAEALRIANATWYRHADDPAFSAAQAPAQLPLGGLWK